MPVKLTKTIIDETRPQEKELLIFDSLVSGFGLQVSQAGAKASSCNTGFAAAQGV